jgi:hypothetical protein
MSNVNFPGYYRVGAFWQYAGKPWEHVGKIKEAATAKDWERLYQWDVRRFLRGEICNSHKQTGDAT